METHEKPSTLRVVIMHGSDALSSSRLKTDYINDGPIKDFKVCCLIPSLTG